MITYLVGLHTEHSRLIKLSSNREGTSVFNAFRLNAPKNLTTLKTVCWDHHTETDRQTDRDRQWETERDRDRETETEKRDRETETARERGRERERVLITCYLPLPKRERERERESLILRTCYLPTSAKDGIVTSIQPHTLLDEAGWFYSLPAGLVGVVVVVRHLPMETMQSEVHWMVSTFKTVANDEITQRSKYPTNQQRKEHQQH